MREMLLKLKEIPFSWHFYALCSLTFLLTSIKIGLGESMSE
jgi:hypothetical protein